MFKNNTQSFSFRRKLIGTGLVAVSALTLCSASLAANPVKYVDVTKGDGIYINDNQVVVTAGKGQYSQVSSGSTVSSHQKMKAGCKGNKSLAHTKIYYGLVTTSGGHMEFNNNYSAGVPHMHAGSIPYTNAHLKIPVNKLGFNPVQVCNNMLQSKMNQGLSKVQVMSKDQVVSQNASFSAVAACGKLGGNNWHYDHKVIGGKIDVLCKASNQVVPAVPMGGNGNIKAKDMVIPAVPLGGNGTINAGYQPLTINKASLLADTLHYTGQCPKELNFSVRLKGFGSGAIKYTVKDGIKNIKSSGMMPYNGKNGWLQQPFKYQVKLDQSKINQKVNHKFDLTVKYRDAKPGSSWKTFNAPLDLNWDHKCKATAKFQMGGQQGGVNFNNQPNPNPNPSNVKRQSTTPEPVSRSKK